MDPTSRCFTPAQASATLGVTAKTLRLYEKHGLFTPDRTRTGWRLYDAATMARAADVVTLRGLGLSLMQVARALDGNPDNLDDGLAAHEARLKTQSRQAERALERTRSLRTALRQGRVPAHPALAEVVVPSASQAVEFALPWPWGGECFALHDLPRLGFITGPLGSGKTRFARALAAALPDAAFLGLDRLCDTALAQDRAADPGRAERVAQRLARLAADGATLSDALTALVTALEAAAPAALVIDMVEEGLNEDTQTSLMADLRLRGCGKRALFLMTRSSAILDLDALHPAEIVIMCPANHAPPIAVAPALGGYGTEAVASCVAAPAVRARTTGMAATLPAPGGKSSPARLTP